MNCKPGDLAIVVRSAGNDEARTLINQLLGKIVRVIRLRPPVDPTCTAIVVWQLEDELTVHFRGMRYQLTGINDECLRPIRDPGDDAQDETLQWLQVPTTEEVTA